MSFNFGSTTQPTFGTPAPVTTGGFGGFTSPAQQQPQQQTTGFGGFGSTSTTAPTFGGFGSTPQQPQQQQHQPQQTSLFGAPQQTSAFGVPQQQQQQQTFGTFGSTASQPATGTFGGFGTTTQQTTGFGGFASPAPAATQPQQTTGFGGFGNTSTTTPTFGGFGSAPQQQQQQQPQQTSLFGAPQQQQQPSAFGVPQQQQQTLPSFGTFGSQPSTVPTLNLGAPASTAPPAFGSSFTTATTTGDSTLSFGLGTSGQPASTGSTLTAAPAFSFGSSTPAAKVPAFSGFGSPAPGTTGGFGSFTSSTPAQSQPTTGLGGAGAAAPTFGGFGSTPQQQQPQQTPAFGAPQQPPAFSAPQQQQQQPPAFGAPQQQQQQQTVPTFGAFGSTGSQQTATSTAAPTLNLGTTASTAPPAFGTTTVTTSAAPTLSFGLGTSAPSATTSSTPATAPAFSFGSSTSTPAAKVPAFGGFGTPSSTSATTTTSASGTLFGTPAVGTTTTTMPAVTSTAASSFGGLGGVSSQPSALLSNISGKTDHKILVNELPLPPELATLVEGLKTQMKTDKVKLFEVSNAQLNKVERVTELIKETIGTVSNLSSILQRHKHSLDSFRSQIVQDIKDAEMAHLVRETPSALQNDNQMPTAYFQRLVQEYESKMGVYGREIKKAEAALSSLETYPGVNAKDLGAALEYTRDSLILIASKIKTLHDRVNDEIEKYNNLLRFSQHGRS